jgi:malonyl-CoA O-methyltransferase
MKIRKRHTTLFDKYKIKKCFNRASDTYDNASTLQYNTGLELINLLKEYKIKPSSLIDLGCGTGSVTKELADSYNGYNKFLAIDIADKLLLQASKRVGHLNVDIYEADFETFDYKDQCFNLIFSNMALQWATDLKSTISKIYNGLSRNGIFAFTLPIKGTLDELKEDRKIHFYEAEQISEILIKSDLEISTKYISSIKLHFDSIITALKSIKEVGANYSNGRTSLTKDMYESLVAKRHTSLTYNIGIFICRRHLGVRCS